jgi:hypothetical protein
VNGVSSQGTAIIWTAVVALDPQAFEVDTLNEYVPEPTVPLIVRPVVRKLPTNAPLTLNR